jgi:glycosyltransferase involved in cell wall biosynthesis
MKLQKFHAIDVSVVMAVKNESKYLSEAVGSIIAQSDCTYEVLLVDDHSTDDTLEIAQKIAIKNPNLIVSKNPASGKCAAFNYGVHHSRGRFICLFAGDDIMPAGSLNTRLQMVRNLPDDEPVIGLSKLITMSNIARFDGHLVPRAAGRGALSGVSPLMNRIAASRIFPVPESLPNEDSWMELAVLHLPNWVLVHSNAICCQYRVHAANSINFMVPFEEYNRKITARLRALPIFLERHGHEMTNEDRLALSAKISCEEQRLARSVWGVLQSSVGLVDKLRALSITNSLLFKIRQKFYGMFSGW